LQRGLCQLDAGLVCCQKGLVLFEQREGLPSGGWRMCVTVRSTAVVTMALAQVPSSGAMRTTWL